MQSTTIEKPTTERLTLFVDPNLSTDVRVLAATHRQTISEFGAEALDYYVKHYNLIKGGKAA